MTITISSCVPVDDAGDYAAVTLSVANIEALLFPHKSVKSFLEEVNERPLPLFIPHKIHQFRTELELPIQHLRSDISSLEEYVRDIYLVYIDVRPIKRVTTLPSRQEPFPAIMATLLQRRFDYGHLDYWKPKITEYVTLLGFGLAEAEHFADPSTARQLGRLGTGFVQGMYEHFSRVQPMQHMTQQLVNINLRPKKNSHATTDSDQFTKKNTPNSSSRPSPPDIQQQITLNPGIVFGPQCNQNAA
ncbi:hypothetical protein F53441_1891 [Fusarium austroafricanum]|uniref:Uncharacterized protein n=1 Tax=Fusarium austroafricanum TaxID=2364996 RepID=A0A8H4KUD9_9HYPO|nr:hypothetical protein F53441_1891 [Fusarium austroafricanum]